MSSDNFYVVRRNQNGFSAVMGFASDGRSPQPRPSQVVYATPEEALASVKNEYAEYGAYIHPECAPEFTHRSPDGKVTLVPYTREYAQEAFIAGGPARSVLLTRVTDALNTAAAMYEQSDGYVYDGYGEDEKLNALIEPYDAVTFVTEDGVMVGTNMDADGNFLSLVVPHGVIALDEDALKKFIATPVTV